MPLDQKAFPMASILLRSSPVSMCAILGGGLKESVAGGALCTERAGLGLITGGDVPDASASVARMPSDRRK